MSFRERKAERIAHYEKWVKGWKSVKCGACNGSGHYDHNGSPSCGACNGTGEEKVSPEEYKRMQEFKAKYG